MRLPILLLTFSLILAGCAGEAPAETDDGLPATKEVDAGLDTGAISGVVVDATITPVAGANVELKTLAMSAVTEADGTFVFPELEPGVYFLEASAERYLMIQMQVTVTAGEVAKPVIQIPGDPTPLPFHQTITFSGHMVASDIYAVYLLTYYVGNTTLCECIFTFGVEPGYKTAVLQGDWTPSIDPTGEHVLYWELWGGTDEEGHTANYLAAGETMRSAGAAFGESQGELWVQVSSSEIPDVEQPFDGFLTLFYVDGAPPGWSFGQ